jgi:hypothetical protein
VILLISQCALANIVRPLTILKVMNMGKVQD